MKKIILFSVLFGLITSSAFATYYKTTTSNCDTNAMLAKLDKATAQHRAVITEVTCDRQIARPAPKRFHAPKKYTHHVKPMPRPVFIPRPTVTVVSITEQENYSCCGC